MEVPIDFQKFHKLHEEFVDVYRKKLDDQFSFGLAYFNRQQICGGMSFTMIDYEYDKLGPIKFYEQYYGREIEVTSKIIGWSTYYTVTFGETKQEQIDKLKKKLA